MNSIFRIAFTVLLQLLFENVEAGETTNSYIFGVFTSVTIYLYHISLHNGYYESQILTALIRTSLSSQIFRKLSKLSKFTVDKSELGKVINLLSNDFNLIEIKTQFVFKLATFIFSFIGVLVILYLRIGWQGLICIAFPTVLIPFYILLIKFNGSLLHDSNIWKDKRIKFIKQTIHHIKSIKIYGWENLIQNLISEIRSK